MRTTTPFRQPHLGQERVSMRLGEFSVQTNGWPESILWPALQQLVTQPLATPGTQTAALLDVYEQAHTQRDFPIAILAKALAAQTAYEEGDNESARRWATEALEITRQVGDEGCEAQLYKLLAVLAFEDGRSKDGHDHLLDALALFDDLAEHQESALLTRWYGEHLAVLGAYPEAQAALSRARDKFANLGDTLAAHGCAADIDTLRQKGF